ncbi:hypothetical protein KPATCC21470_5764 [Kitasatospora purpeofusca]
MPADRSGIVPVRAPRNRFQQRKHGIPVLRARGFKQHRNPCSRA